MTARDGNVEGALPADVEDVLPADAEGVEGIVASMTLEQKLAQLVGVWAGFRDEPVCAAVQPEDGAIVAPGADEQQRADVDSSSAHGLGQLARWYGTRPVDPATARAALAVVQQQVADRSGHGIGAVVHEECLTGVTAHGATTFPCPLAWGATWNPEIVQEAAAAIGASLRQLHVHQGLAPVLDVARDPRWGRVEECIGEDPLLVGTIGTAYVRGLEGAGVVATLKHFVGYSASHGGRNMAPVSVGTRELADVFLPPFLMAVREGHARSVMNAYVAVDGIPMADHAELLSAKLRDQWGFAGTVVADYSAIAMLHELHRVAADLTEAATRALTAGIDVELPTGNAYLGPLADAVRSGTVAESLVDQAVLRVLRQKVELGLVGGAQRAADAQPVDGLAGADGPVDLDPPTHRAVARRLAEQSVVLLHNAADPVALLPMPDVERLAVVGPVADDPLALLGSYSFPNHVGRQHPGVPLGIEVPTVLDAVREEFPAAHVTHAPGGTVDGSSAADIAGAVALAAQAQVCLAVIGDRPGLFGRGTVGEGCDSETLTVPGAQRRLVEALLDTGTPVVVVLVTGRPYVIDWLLPRASAVVQAFLPGEEGASAVAGVLSGRVGPSGRLPVTLPRSVGVQPHSYLAPASAGAGFATSIDPTPVFPFGHGLGYARVDYGSLVLEDEAVATDGAVVVHVELANASSRPTTEVVQLYAADLARSVVPPERQLVAWHRTDLAAGERVRIRIAVPADLFCFTDRSGRCVVEPGGMTLMLGRSATDIVDEVLVELVGPLRVLADASRALVPSTEVVGRWRS